MAAQAPSGVPSERRRNGWKMADATDTAGPSTSAAGLSFWMLGPLSVTRSGEELGLGGRQQRAVLASLLIEAGHTVSRARLSEQLWGDDVPRGAATTIQTYVSHLRNALEPGRGAGDPPTLLVTRNGGYRLDADPADIDSSVFRHRLQRGQALLRSGDRRDAVAASAELQQALSLWRTGALSDLLDYSFAEEESNRLHELRLIATEALADADLRLGRDAEVIETVGPLLEGNPLRERLHEQLMLAMYRSGRQADALEVHRRLVTHLVEELGADPGPAIQALHVAILRHDRHLDGAAPSRSALASRSSTERIAPPEQPRGPDLDPAKSRSLHLHPLVVAAAWLFRARPRAVAGTVGVVAVLAGAATMQPGTGASPPPALAANAVSELDESGAVAASVPVGTNPVAAASVHGAIWVTNSSDDNVYQINPATRAVEREVHVGDVPQSLAVTGHDLWVANFASGTVSRIDVLARRVVQRIHVGSGPAAIAAGASGLWVANSGDNTIQRIDTRSGTADDPIPVGDGPDGLAVDDRSVWVANGRAGSVTRVEVRTREPMYAPIPVGSGPRGIVRSGDDVWVADELSQSVTRISIPTRRTHSIDVGDGPTALAVHRGAVWVAEKYSGDLVRIDPDTEKTTRLDVRGAVRGLAVVAGRLWVVSGAAASPAHRGGILRVAAGPLPGHNSGIDPANVYDLTTGHAIRAVYDGLLAYHYASADSQVLVPDLATSVPEPTDGGRTYTFNLHPGVRYSTGRRVKASDFARGVQRALFAREGNSGFYAGIVGGQACIDDHRTCDLSKGVVADDAEGRVTFHLTAPDPQFNHKLTLLVVPAPPGTPMHTIATPLPGTGPYRIASYVPDKRFTLARNPYFHEWSAGAQPAGFVDGMVWAKVADARAAADAVTQGRADLAE
ncbi:MAG: hypothetical protein QOF53_978, partial [Nocardioidaceae bacterium]|nr:hypothetical protein [Nocardioidaceae bacterium]